MALIGCDRLWTDLLSAICSRADATTTASTGDPVEVRNMTDSESYEHAMQKLAGLVRQGDFAEAQYQKWFEDNRVIFEIYGCKTVLPHPELVQNRGITPADRSVLIPDFMVERIDGTWEIFEIKRPDTPILKESIRRQTFYASMHEYIQQISEYIEYFDDSNNRADFLKKYGVIV
jgi:hypothetical protein